jgi:glycosyltransferase involved in cell wall biosynthesis
VTRRKALNILQVIPELDAGGAERTTIEVAEAIVAAGGRALVASRGGRLEDELTAVGGELLRLDAKTKNPLTIWRNAGRLAQAVKAEQIDLIHARSRAPAWSAKWAAARTGAPFVTTYHGTYSARSGLKRRYNAVMAAGDRVIANSQFIANHVRAEHGVGEDRLRVIPRGVDLTALDPATVDADAAGALRKAWGASPEDVVILLPARLTRWKGQAFFIAALGGFEEKDRCRLVCLGDAQGRDAYVDELRQAAKSHDVRLVLPGHARDMKTAYAAADVVVCPSLEPEAFGRTAAEAQAMGAPVIASAHGGACEVVAPGETGWLAAPGDSAAWRAALAAALGQSAQARQVMAQAARERITNQFSTAALQSATLRVYRELIE